MCVCVGSCTERTVHLLIYTCMNVFVAVIVANDVVVLVDVDVVVISAGPSHIAVRRFILFSSFRIRWYLPASKYQSFAHASL